MPVALNAYLHFRGQARDALEFYRSVFGGEVTVSTFADFGMPMGPGEDDLVMHGQLEGEIALMAADTPAAMQGPDGDTITLALFGDTADDAILRGWFSALATGGAVELPLETAPWGAAFGQVRDRFGISWMVNIGSGGPQG